METLRYLTAALACGVIAVWASENLFWSAPPADWTTVGMALTWVAYALASACALSAVAWTGCGGWRGLFLGGAVMGVVVEGVVVDTMYDAFPFQLVWTPLAWHALISALAVGGIGRAAGRWPVWRVAAAYAALGVGAGTFGLYWPVERGDMGSIPSLMLAGYLAGFGLALPLAQIVLDPLRTVPRPHGAVLLAVPLLALAQWTAKTVAAPDPVRLAGPAMALVTLWAMRRLGSAGAVAVGGPVPPARHALALLVPLGALAVLVPGYAALPGGAATNVPTALITAPVGFGLWLWCLWQAVRRAPPAPPPDRAPLRRARAR